jgi:hypothetical protein
MSEIRAEYKIMTKQAVDSLLECNVNNRNIRQRVVAAYARDMQSGAWQTTHQGIAVSKDGMLIDGQHRLEALKKAGYPKIEMLVVTGLQMDAQKVVDQGAKRSLNDVLRVAFEYRFSRHAPSVSRAIIMINTGGMSSKVNPTPNEVIDVIEKYFDEINEVTSAPCDKCFFAAPYLAAFVIALSENKSAHGKVIEFIKKVEAGEMLSKDDPAFHLRTFVINTRGHTGGLSLTEQRYAKAYKAAIAHIKGEKMKVLRS